MVKRTELSDTGSSSLERKVFWTSVGVGCLFITIWTWLRIISRDTNFDQVGQQVLTHQILHGGLSHAFIGATNYLPKMLFIYAPLDVLGLSPAFNLFASTLLINLVTFISMTLSLRYILTRSGGKVTTSFYMAMAWLSVIAGSVFWISFANSRNLEVVGGLLLIILILRWINSQRLVEATLATAFASILFMSDPLQIYVTGGAIILFVLLITLHAKNTKLVVGSVAILGVGVILSKMYMLGITRALSLSFVQPAGNSLPHSLSGISNSITGFLVGSLQLINGGNGLPTDLRIIDGLIGLGAVTYSTFAYAWKRVLPKSALLAGSIIFVNIGVYILSGQALIRGTSRYLIMMAPALILWVAAAPNVLKWNKKIIGSLIIVVISLNGIFLVQHLTLNSRSHTARNVHMHDAVAYISSTTHPFGFTSIDTALTTTYYYPGSTQPLLPLGCLGDKLVISILFYDGGRIALHLHSGDHQAIPLIYDGSEIANLPNRCRVNDAIAQFGQPIATQKTPAGSTVLVYPLVTFRDNLSSQYSLTSRK